MFNIMDAVEEAVQTGPDMNESQGGGDFERELPAEGFVKLRLISYIEIGKHSQNYNGDVKINDKVKLQFELSGPKHPPIKMGDALVPHVITITENLSLSEKANFFKLFNKLNPTKEYRHFSQLLGKAFVGTVVQNSKGEGTDKKTYANLRDANGYTIRPAFVDDPETGDKKPVQVDPPVNALKCFLWGASPKFLQPMWDTLFIDGKYEDKKDKEGNVVKEGRSKNFWQDTIMSAVNFTGSPIEQLLKAGGTPDVPDAEKPLGGGVADPLAGV
ncbi:hypothetical protein [Aquisediminimonas sediminicola]|uniref:hypothetical protein n=1 Tax=Alteraquisediminimonas sediminicola TaxID=2676787 RepID=UPI001C8D1029|nr:hypothetical protein [Aquisediminimonas sediminicola]